MCTRRLRWNLTLLACLLMLQETVPYYMDGILSARKMITLEIKQFTNKRGAQERFLRCSN